jgi:cyclohexanecarboxyl-CoA dehydrogenase
MITEPDAGTDAASLGLRATPDGDDAWVLNGEKTSITLGMASDGAVVLARTGGPGARGVSAFWVDLSDPGISRSAFDDLGARAIGRASIHFDDVRSPAPT